MQLNLKKSKIKWIHRPMSERKRTIWAVLFLISAVCICILALNKPTNSVIGNTDDQGGIEIGIVNGFYGEPERENPEVNMVFEEVEVPKYVDKVEVVNSLPFEVNEYADMTVRKVCECDSCDSNKVRSQLMKNMDGVVAYSSDLKDGTKIYIKGIGIRQIQHSPYSLSNNEVVVYTSSHDDVVAYGSKVEKVYLLD